MSALLLQMVRSIDAETAQRVEDLLLPLAEDMLWGTFGKGAMEAYEQSGTPLPEVRYVRLGDCETSHLEAIQRNIERALLVNPMLYRSYHLPHMAAELILADRKAKQCRSTWSSARLYVHGALSWIRTTWSTSAQLWRR